MDCLQLPPTIFRVLTHSIHILSIPTYFIAVTALICVKSSVFTTYRLFLIWHLMENLFFEMYSSFLIVPTVHPPFTLIRTTGLLSNFGVSPIIQFYVLATAIEFNGLSVSEMFYFRYKAGLLNYREHRFTLFFRSCVYFTRLICFIDVVFCIFTFSDASDFQLAYKTKVYQNSPFLNFLSCSNIYLVVPFADYVSTVILASWIIQTINLSASVPLAVAYISKNVPKSISPATWKIQQHLLWSLTIQAAVHGVMLGVPNTMFIYALFFGYSDENLGYIAFLCLTYHGFVSAFGMIIFTRPLREYIMVTLKVKKMRTASVSTSKSA